MWHRFHHWRSRRSRCYQSYVTPRPYQPHQLQQLPHHKKLKEGFSYVKESTSSNPEGLHHRHWKSQIQDNAVFEPFALMIMFAFRWGEPPAVWSNSIQICLPKDDPNTPTKITRIRRIQLVCAGLNMGFQIIWGHEMLQRAIKTGHVFDYQLGGHSGHTYISAILLKRVSYDLIQQMRLTAAIFDNDAKAAYNRMIPSQCMILSTREGVWEEEIETHLQVLRETKYRVKTAHGVSPNWFQSTLALPILGLLQGSAAVSAMWTYYPSECPN
jgi:hypothetical protein